MNAKHESSKFYSDLGNTSSLERSYQVLLYHLLLQLSYDAN